MINLNPLAAFPAESLETSSDYALQQRLGLYRVFLKLYEHNRELLDEILNLENSGNKSLTGVALPYVQGLVLGDRVHLVTNLLKGATQSLSQPQNIWTIGRDSRRVVLPIQDKRLSRCHAAIVYDEGGFRLVDLNSSNGSYLNGELIRHSVRLKDGDRIRLGSLTFSFFVCNTAQVLPPVSEELLSQVRALSAASEPKRAIAHPTAPSASQPSPLSASSIQPAFSSPLTKNWEESVSESDSETCLQSPEDALPAQVNPLEDTLMFMRSSH
ncbi:FHA domain-containing protein [Thermoleptolyngbya sp. C42_A2020_037]|uniref:FHA domain-containing protein n=1 Tax=Thermoleptolyngbya sp. C42_A2020_037 TaxID=2747799 RepID=UPI0019EF96A2|nr:FHA domain-containing protein [Thermoleptolyngbya sp. C42_A2020_037]MBF2085702.1 FHA domain-containing protein [Thermoleptolyngbya sp. C42_A2020_037]